MPLFEVTTDGLVSFRQLRGGADLYESEIEALLWANLDDLSGEALFPISRQPTIPSGGRPDIVALDRSGAVVVIEVKREVDRNQLAQCLEYAGWGRTTSLDELAGMYHRGEETFWQEWMDFTDSTEPVRISKSPRLMLVARDFHGRTRSALDFLIENKLPIKIISVGLYEDTDGRRFLDLEGVEEPGLTVGENNDGDRPNGQTSARVGLADLLGAGLLKPGERLVWRRPRLDATYHCVVTDDARLRADDGRIFTTPSGAAMTLADVGAYDGWHAWKLTSRPGVPLDDLRQEFLRLDRNSAGGGGESPALT